MAREREIATEGDSLTEREPKQPSELTVRLIGWFAYIIACGVMLLPWVLMQDKWGTFVSAALLLGHFSQILNAIKIKKHV